MSVIFVKFKEFVLGELTFVNGCFCYNIYDNNVKQALDEGYPIYLYDVDKNFISEKLPESLLDFIPNKNTFIYTQAGITEGDSQFEMLAKVANLNLANDGLFVSTK